MNIKNSRKNIIRCFAIALSICLATLAVVAFAAEKSEDTQTLPAQADVSVAAQTQPTVTGPVFDASALSYSDTERIYSSYLNKEDLLSDAKHLGNECIIKTAEMTVSDIAFDDELEQVVVSLDSGVTPTYRLPIAAFPSDVEEGDTVTVYVLLAK